MRWERALLGVVLGMCVVWQSNVAGSARAAPEEQDAVSELLALVNAARITNDLPPYALNPLLTQVAQAHSEYQRDIGHWSHEGENGTLAIDRVLAAGYPAARVNENLYATSSGDPQVAVDWWLTADEEHRDNVLHPAMREVGFGAATDAEGVVYFTMDISAQPNVLPVFINDDAASTSSQYVTITLTNETIFSSAPEQIGWAEQVLISNSPDFTEGDPQSWAQTIPWTLDTDTGTGTKTVYVRFMDGNGQTTDSQASIFLEAFVATTAPPADSQPTVTPTLRPPPSTYTPALLSPSPPLTTTPTGTPGSLPSQPATPPTESAPSASAVQVTGASMRMLFAVTLGLGVSALLAGIYLLMRPAH